MLEDLDIHEGLPASGDTVQQENITRLRRSHRGNCGSLRSRWTMAIGQPGRSCREWIAIDNLCFDDNRPRFSSPFNTDDENESFSIKCSSVLRPPIDSSSSNTARCWGARAKTFSRSRRVGRSARMRTIR
jgi:hypothetical protein